MSHDETPIGLGQLNIVVRDLPRSMAFYRLLGVEFEVSDDPRWSEWLRHHVNGVAANGVRVELDSVAFAKQWHPALDESRLGSAVIPMFHVATRDEVDRIYARVVAAGHRSHLAPEDAFWGARYAIVQNPDGASVGITSAVDPAMREPPPSPPRE